MLKSVLARPKLHFLVALGVVGILAVTYASSHGDAADSPSMYWGGTVTGSTYGMSGDPPWNMAPLDTFESHVGKKASIIHFGSSWYVRASYWPYDGYYPFMPTLMDSIRARGAIPMFSWQTAIGGMSRLNPAQETTALSRIIEGNRYGAFCDVTVTPSCKTYDAYVTEWATAAKNWGYPFFLRLNWEMNGNWFAWSEQAPWNSSGEYVKAWRHVHDIFTSVGANNVTWLWCPNTEYPGSAPLAGLYPGDAYVDWTCADVYNFGTHPSQPETWRTFSQIFKPTYDRLMTIAPAKPIFLAEVASTEYGGSKATWIQDMLTNQFSSAFPNVKGFAWFNWNSEPGSDWIMESSSSAQNAFANGISNARYATNAFSNSPSGMKIEPLSTTAWQLD